MQIPLPSDLKRKYPHVPDEEIIDAIEIATIRSLQKVHGKAVGAFYGVSGLDVYLYSGIDFSHVDLSRLRRRNKRRLLDELEIELMKRQACNEAKEYRTTQGAV